MSYCASVPLPARAVSLTEFAKADRRLILARVCMLYGAAIPTIVTCPDTHADIMAIRHGRALPTPSAIAHYQKRISGPLVDCFEVYVEAPRVKYVKQIGKGAVESSAQARHLLPQVSRRSHGLARIELSARLLLTTD